MRGDVAAGLAQRLGFFSWSSSCGGSGSFGGGGGGDGSARGSGSFFGSCTLSPARSTTTSARSKVETGSGTFRLCSARSGFWGACSFGEAAGLGFFFALLLLGSHLVEFPG
jgi:hypothetical protein